MSGRVDFSASYDVQQVCLNGHVTNNHVSDEARNQIFCNRCGAKTITACQHCEGPIRGAHRYNPHSPTLPPPEAYCLHCGRPYPWTQASFDALRAIATVSEGLSDDDREQLAEMLPDLITREDTPRTHVVALKMKKLLKKGGTVFAEAVRKTIVDVTSETIKKILVP
jgi:hypothetical protein